LEQARKLKMKKEAKGYRKRQREADKHNKKIAPIKWI